MKISRKIMKKHWAPKKLKKHEWMIEKKQRNRWTTNENQRKNTNTKEKHQVNQWKPMNKNNDKQRTTHENYGEPKKNLWTNRGKNNENHRKTNEKPRRNNEKQWKTKDNFASIQNYFRPVICCPCFFEFSIFNVERNKRQFWKKKETCTLMEENTPAGENLACHFIPKICILYGNTVVPGLAHWNLEYSHAGILKYPIRNRVFGGILNWNCQILENLAAF